MSINTATATMADIKAADTSELLEVYNKITGRTTKKFADRKTGEQQTWNVIQQLAPGEDINKSETKSVAKKPKKEKAVKEPRKRIMRFCFAPGAAKSLRSPRAGSLRARLFDLLQQKNGLLFSEIHKEFPKWSKQNIYEAIRLIHFTTNYGMWSNPENGDIRVQIITDSAKYKELVSEAKAA